MGAATAIEWRTVGEVVKAEVRSTLAAALAEVQRAPTVEWTVQDGEVRKPVTGEARTGEANTEPGVLTTSVNEADGASAAMSPKAASRARAHGGLCMQRGREAAGRTVSTCSRRRCEGAAP